MPQPPAYNRTKNFTENFGNETDHAAINSELDNAANSINDIRTNIALLQADDGKLRPAVVTTDAVSADLKTYLINQAAQGAADSAATATTKAAEASTSAGNAAASETNAAASASAALSSKNAAATSETNAANYAASIDPATLVKLSGAQTIADVKTFTASPIIPDVADGDLSGKAVNSKTVGLPAKAGMALNTLRVKADETGYEHRTPTQARGDLGAAASGANADITSLDSLASINGGQLAGLRNKIINGNPLINQRGVASASTAYAAGAYILDRWKAGAGGATLSFATADNIVTITITAGSIIQVVEGLNLQSGTYTLSWSGTAQGKIGAGAFSASGVTGAITGGTDTNIEFNVGTVSLMQLEFGSVATPFEHRLYGLELALCQRFYNLITVSLRGTSGPSSVLASAYIFPLMRAIPTTTLGGSPSFGNVTSESTTVTPVTVNSICYQLNATAANTDTYALARNILLSAEL